MKKIYTLLVLLLASHFHLSSQCSLYPVSLSDCLNNSSLVIEGEVISQKSFWNSTGNYIYTSNLISIKRILKGKSEAVKLEVITEGGEIDQKKQTVEPSLQLKPGDEGVFTLNTFNELPSQFGFSIYKVYADIQGFILYDLRNESASGAFEKYSSITKDLYPKLNANLGITLSAYVNTSGKGYSSGTTAAVTGFSPTTITAGTSSMITITGTGFGTVQSTSYVEFYNADDGGATYIQPHSSQYVSWSNTQIQVMVPTRASTVAGTAGTGPIRVTVAGSPTVSTQTLTVSYGELNLYYSANSTIYNTRHVDLNGSAGITWQMYSTFDANSSAKTSFLSSLQTWRCNTYINWGSGSTTTVNSIGADGTSVVRFDIGSELPVGVLGRCTSYFSGCITGTVVNWYVSELDICFDEPSTSAITWQFGPSLATGVQYDFETVSLHELGHGHQLSHVINSGDVMHYALSNAQNKRSLISNNINGGNDVMIRNVSTGVCGMNAMTALSATACSLSAPTASFNLTNTVCVGQTVTFTDVSTGSPTSWSWTIAGGSTGSSTLQNPSTSYASAGIYSISLAATGAFGTSTVLTKTISVLANPNLTVSAATICSGTSTVLTVSGATSYTWNPGNLTGATQTLNPSGSTNYTLLGSNGSCTATTTSSVTVISTPTVNVPNASICSGTSTLITANGASSYTWNPGNLSGASQNLSPAGTSVYTLTGSSSGCNAATQFTINVTTTPTVSVNTTSICSGNSAVLTASGAISYIWNPGILSGASQNLNPSASTIYTVTGANGTCTHSITTTLSVTSTPTLSVSDASICSGTSTLLTATGASAYVWMPGTLSGGSQNLNPPSTSIYTITGTIGSCTSAITTTVNVTSTPTIAASNASICPGGSAVITASGAAGYTWVPGNLTGASQTLNPASTAIYTISGNNGNCVNSKTISLHVYTVFPVFGISSPPSICFGETSSIMAAGGISYTWTAPSYTATGSSPPPVNPSVTTIYNLAGSDGTCVTTNTVLLTVNPLPTVTVPYNHVCAGNSVAVNAGGADSYTWMPGGFVGSTLTLTPTSTMIFTVTGKILLTGCTNTAGNMVPFSPLPSFTVIASPTLVCLGNNGTLTATNNYTYSCLPSGTVNGSTIVVTPLTNTTYTLTRFDGLCSATNTVNVVVSSPPSITVASTGTACSNTSYSLFASGAFSHTWNPGNIVGNTNTLIQTSTVFTVTGSSSVGCTSSATQTVSVTPTPTLALGSSHYSLCSGQNQTMSVSGATGNYTWMPGALIGTNVVVTSTSIGAIIYTITANNGSCLSNTASIVLHVNPNPTLTFLGIPTGSVCEGSQFSIFPMGATSYSWGPGLTGTSINIVAGNTNSIISVIGTTNTTGCSSTETISIQTVPAFTMAASASSTMVCAQNNVTLSATGGTSIVWSPGSAVGSSVVVTPSATTLYQAIGNFGPCSTTVGVVILVNAIPGIFPFSNNPSICAGESTPISAGGSGVSWNWQPGNLNGFNVTVSPQNTTIYSVTALGTNGCSSTETITIYVSPSPSLNFNLNPLTFCPGQTTTISASGATNYTWTASGNNSFSITVSPTVSTIYQLTGKTGSCTATKQITLNPLPSPPISIVQSSSTLCYGGTVSLSANGAATYTWEPVSISATAVVVSPSINTIYTVTGTYANSCKVQNTVNITVVPNPTLLFIAPQKPICAGESLTLAAGGANNLTWLPLNVNSSNAVISPSTNSSYTLVGETGGCSSELQFTITVDLCEGLHEFTGLENFRIYPNPFNSELNLNFGLAFNGKIELYNSLGQIISTQEVINLREMKIQVPEIAKGAYVLRIRAYNTESVKIIKLLKD